MAVDAVAGNFNPHFTPFIDCDDVTTMIADLPAATFSAITPFTSGSRQFCRLFEPITKWNLQPLSPLCLREHRCSRAPPPSAASG